MSAKIIDSHRYKTITKTQLDKKRKKAEGMLKYQKKSHKISNRYSTNDSNGSTISNLRIKKHRERKIEREMLLYSRPQRTVLKEPKQKIYIPKSFIVLCCVLVLIMLVYISAKIMKTDEKVSVDVFSNNDFEKENVTLESNYDLNIGLTSFYDNNYYTSKNLILNDLVKQTSLSLVNVKDDYSLVYKVAKAIEKKSSKEYIITLNTDYKLNIDDINYSINKILDSGSNNLYYERISLIESVESVDNKKDVIKITLKEEDPYFVYSLDFPIIDNDNVITSDYIYNEGVFTRSKKSDEENISSITLKNYSNINEVVDKFINKEIDIFFATSNNDMQLIGKNEYNVKKYKDGETLFIFGNKNSDIFSRKEVRKSLMYSLNREEIVKNSDNNFIELIDLPFLYSGIKYKYDIVGATNIMESNEWNKNSYGIFEKVENGKYINASLRLLVNEQDSNKVNVANNIKNMAQNSGINIEVETANSDTISQRIQSGDYDLVLATVYLNEIPNVNFLKQYVNINDATQQAFTQVEQSSIQDIDKNIQNLEQILSEEVACIGIYARNINLVYQRYIYGFENLNYMNIFSNLDNIGKIIE